MSPKQQVRKTAAAHTAIRVYTETSCLGAILFPSNSSVNVREAIMILARLAFVLVLANLLSLSVSAQFGGGMVGGGMVGGGFTPPPVVKRLSPQTETSQKVSELLDQKVQLGEIKEPLENLASKLMKSLQVPVFLNGKAVEIAGLKMDTVIEADLVEMPVRSALRFLLHKHGLRAVVENEGLVITADFEVLTRRGIATDQWLSGDLGNQKIQSQMGNKISVKFVEVPLDEAMKELSHQLPFDILIDARALEEIGLTTDTPVTFSCDNITLRSTLRLMLRDLDLTYMVKDEMMQITTIEAAEQNLVGRIYYLEGIGAGSSGDSFDFDSAIQLVQTSIVPDTWEALGGPSTMTPTGVANRPGILVSTTTDVHDQIAVLFRSLRESLVDPDRSLEFEPQPPVVAPAQATPAAQAQGGMF